jgi:hypothetical protein
MAGFAARLKRLGKNSRRMSDAATGAEARTDSKSLYAALKAPLFHVTRCIRRSFLPRHSMDS